MTVHSATTTTVVPSRPATICGGVTGSVSVLRFGFLPSGASRSSDATGQSLANHPPILAGAGIPKVKARKGKGRPQVRSLGRPLFLLAADALVRDRCLRIRRE